MKDTILFDLDGTLLPMDQDIFLKVYFKELAKKCATHGFDPATIPEAVWAGTKTMMANDGGASNEQRFWDTFASILGEEVREMIPVLERLYEEEFHNVRSATGENPAAARLIPALRQQGYTLVLASNPLFPSCAYNTRLSWIGLSADDVDHITDYASYHYCKPNPAYYREILDKIGKDASQCLMIGNDVQEDAWAAAQVGLDTYIVTDYLIEGDAPSETSYPSGNFAEMDQWIRGQQPI